MVRRSAPLGLALVTLAAAGCGADDTATVRVVAATSLKGAIETAAARYEAEHDGVNVQSTFAPSDQIQRQIEGGLDADVVAMASEDQMAPLVKADLAEDAAPFAGNKLAIAVGDDSTAGLTDARDLANPIKLSLGQAEVPIGKYADESIAAMAKRYGAEWGRSVNDNVVNRAPNASDVITPVALGGVDASISYATDLKANAGRVRAVEIPAWAQPKIAYWIAAGTESSDAGEDFIAYVESEAGQAVLQAQGFLPVPTGAGAAR